MVIYAAVAASAPVAAMFQKPQAPVCQLAGSIMRIADLPEASGLAVSLNTPGRLWAHNDSGKPEIFAVDTKGRVTGRVLLSGAQVVDWEAIASAHCGSGACLYVADIGDNAARRKHITVYRLAEPARTGGTAQVDAVLRAAYPDGPHDAEALLAAPDGTLYIVTKGETGPVALYRFPRDAGSGKTVQLERIGAPLSRRLSSPNGRITDGAISADGDQVVLRTPNALRFYRSADFLKADFRETRSMNLKPLKEPQGEGVAFGPSNIVYVAGEGGGKSQPGTLAALSCPR